MDEEKESSFKKKGNFSGRRNFLIGTGVFAFLAGGFGVFLVGKEKKGNALNDEDLADEDLTNGDWADDGLTNGDLVNGDLTNGDDNQAMNDKDDQLAKDSKKDVKGKQDKIVLSDGEWKKRLPEEVYRILRKEGTERPFTSPLNDEKRQGIYHCRGCDLKLFHSKMKYDSGTGWPSFYTTIDGAFETKSDYFLVYKRTEYHCSRCGGHHGHVFDDGPPPTNQRWCNNGLALKFVPFAKQQEG